MPAKRSMWSYLRRYPLMFWRGSAGGAGYNTLIVLGPILLGRALDSVLALEEAGVDPASLRRLHTDLFLLVLATAAFQFLRTVKRWDFRRMSNRVGTDIQAEFLAATLAWPLGRLDRERIGDLMSRSVGDVQVVAETIMTTITELFDTAVLMLAYFAVLLYYSPGLTLLASLPAPLTVACSHYAGKLVFARSAAARAAASAVNSHLQESLTGVRVLRLFGREADERARFAVLTATQLKANLSLTLLQSGLMPVYAAVASLGLVAVIGLGGQRVAAGQWTVGSFTAYLTMFLAMTTRVLMAARVLNRLHAGRAAWARIAAKLVAGGAVDAAPATAPSPEALAQGTAPRREGIAVEIGGLGFSYPGDARPALDGVDLSFPAGAIVCVTGPVGSGKSALAAALTGQYPYRGSIRLDGHELRGFSAGARQAAISFAGQNPFLFSATIRENIAFAPVPDDDPRFVAAIHGAALARDIGLFERGWDTPVGEYGLQVSGGQRQRIALARALYARPGLLVLDDPFSAVDIGTEDTLLANLRQAAGGATVVLFSHRLASFVVSDRVVLMDGGRVAAAGTHAELVATNATYRRIYRAQAWLEERSQ